MLREHVISIEQLKEGLEKLLSYLQDPKDFSLTIDQPDGGRVEGKNYHITATFQESDDVSTTKKLPAKTYTFYFVDANELARYSNLFAGALGEEYSSLAMSLSGKLPPDGEDILKDALRANPNLVTITQSSGIFPDLIRYRFNILLKDAKAWEEKKASLSQQAFSTSSASASATSNQSSSSTTNESNAMSSSKPAAIPPFKKISILKNLLWNGIILGLLIGLGSWALGAKLSWIALSATISLWVPYARWQYLKFTSSSYNTADKINTVQNSSVKQALKLGLHTKTGLGVLWSFRSYAANRNPWAFNAGMVAATEDNQPLIQAINRLQ